MVAGPVRLRPGALAPPWSPKEGHMNANCTACGTLLDEDDILWAAEDGTLTMHGEPWCAGCAPEEQGYDAR